MKKIKPAKLYNCLTATEAKALLAQESFNRKTISFYKYFSLTDPQFMRDDMYKNLSALQVFGRIYLAHEGINAQISVPEHNFDALRDYLYSIASLKGIRLNLAIDDLGQSFWILKIKTRSKIVADGINDPNFSLDKRGAYVGAEEFNKLAEDPATVIIDMRNHYEYEIGHFANAIEIPSETFREQLPMVVEIMQDKKDKNIIIYCTGGIRCEKASAWMQHNGFAHVRHLEGGIINYINSVNEKHLDNKFIGKNFVFDGRLGEQIGEAVISKCHQCGNPADTHINCATCHLLFIQCQQCHIDFAACCSKECQSVASLPDEEQERFKNSLNNGTKIFNKSKARLGLLCL